MNRPDATCRNRSRAIRNLVLNVRGRDHGAFAPHLGLVQSLLNPTLACGQSSVVSWRSLENPPCFRGHGISYTPMKPPEKPRVFEFFCEVAKKLTEGCAGSRTSTVCRKTTVLTKGGEFSGRLGCVSCWSSQLCKLGNQSQVSSIMSPAIAAVHALSGETLAWLLVSPRIPGEQCAIASPSDFAVSDAGPAE